MTPKFCRQCGRELAEAAKFCSGCGVEIAPASTTSTSDGHPVKASVRPNATKQKLILVAATIIVVIPLVIWAANWATTQRLKPIDLSPERQAEHIALYGEPACIEPRLTITPLPEGLWVENKARCSTGLVRIILNQEWTGNAGLISGVGRTGSFSGDQHRQRLVSYSNFKKCHKATSVEMNSGCRAVKLEDRLTFDPAIEPVTDCKYFVTQLVKHFDC